METCNLNYCNVTCKTQNVVYLLQCRCGMQYVGETEQPFNKRMNGHRSDYTCKPDLPVSRHLRSPGHAQADLKTLTITIIDHNEGWSKVDRVARERFWIRKLRTVSPEGLNEKNIEWVIHFPVITFFQKLFTYYHLFPVTPASALDLQFKFKK